MTQSIVKIYMRGEHSLDCSYAIVSKEATSVIIILRESECAIFDYNQFKADSFSYKYLLFKHYPDTASAYNDFWELIGKMCKKHEDSKYFLNHKNEDNRMAVTPSGTRMLLDEDKATYSDRYATFKQFVQNNAKYF